MSSGLNNINFDLTIVICTRDRASFLRETLRSLVGVRVPAGLKVELLIVDNGSTDDTQQVIQRANLDQFDLRILYEARPGVSNAKNRAVRNARGAVLLFTDDDVRLPRNWIAGMMTPITSGEADAVAGAVELAPHLRRPWQKNDPWLTTPLATTEVLDADDPQRLVGANMAIRRSVFEVVPGFDPDLGPGSERGLGEETLLTHQLKHSGFRVVSAFDVVVEHHCAEERLTRQSYLNAAKKIGRSQGYIDYHWKGAPVDRIRLAAFLIFGGTKLFLGRHVVHDKAMEEGLPGWEMSLLTQLYHTTELFRWSGMPRKYASKNIEQGPRYLRIGTNNIDRIPSSDTDVSVVICTRDRAHYLSETLRSFRSVRVPNGMDVELVIVDNASDDHTTEVVGNFALPEVNLRLITAPEPGLSRARNRALRVARGRVLLFTDDDVRLPRDWIEGMASPILYGKADAVAGGVELAPHLRRPWQNMDPWLATPLATTNVLDADDPKRVVGANMAIGSHVFDVIHGFDEHLGAGSELGMGEETLLTHQIKHHGFRVVSAFDVVVEHHCDEDRLTRERYLKAVEKIGRSQGFIDYHWHGKPVSRITEGGSLSYAYAKLLAGRALRRKSIGPEALPGWEMVLLTRIYHKLQLLQESGKPRRYKNRKITTDPHRELAAETS